MTKKADARSFSVDLMHGEYGYRKENGERAEKQVPGTSIFDPVLCELVYQWFSAEGMQVLDPFAGGSVRGIVAAVLGRPYVGIDLSARQIEANRAQAASIAATNPLMEEQAHPMSPCDIPVVDEIEGFRIVRDDLLAGGTKRRMLERMIQAFDSEEFVYATPAFGYAQVALALACRDAGKRAAIFVAKRARLHPRTAAAKAAGAVIHEIPAGRINVIEARAREYCEKTGASQIPFGCDHQIAVDAIAEIALSTGEDPAEVWCVAGSGVLTRALQKAWPNAVHHAVQIGTDRMQAGKAKVHKAPEEFQDDARSPPPFPSCGNYDAKAWAFMQKHASPGALFWNVAADEALWSKCSPAVPQWIVGDSRDVAELAQGLEADLLFSCPPYADLERYSDDPADISTLKYPQFVEAYRQIIAAACGMLKQNRFACFVVGEVRGTDGAYLGFVPDTIRAFQDAGLQLYNEAILVTAVGSLPIRAGRYFETSRKLGKTHQNVLVFIKGDAKAATQACGIVEFEMADAQDDAEE